MKLCSIPECGKKYLANGYCAQHNARFKKYGDPVAPIKNRWDNHVQIMRPCQTPGCGVSIPKGTYCGKCRQRKHRHGDTTIVKPKHREHFFNEEIFHAWTKESAYLLGWAVTDGGVINESGNYYISWRLKDKDATETIQSILNHPKPPTKRVEKDNAYWEVRVHSKKLVTKLEEIGIKPNKSLTVECPEIPEEFLSHFFRGAVDGDGSIQTKGTYLGVVLYSASHSFLNKLKDKIKFDCVFRTEDRKHLNKNDMHSLLYSSHISDKVCEWMYKDSENLRLERKFNNYQKWLYTKN
jgi:hypothetical protein